MTTGSRKRGLYAGAGGDGNRGRWSAGRRRPAASDWTGEAPVSPSISEVHSTGGGRMRSPHLSMDYRLAGTSPASAADGIVVTRPCVPVACAGTAVGDAADAAAGIIPRALRT